MKSINEIINNALNEAKENVVNWEVIKQESLDPEKQISKEVSLGKIKAQNTGYLYINTSKNTIVFCNGDSELPAWLIWEKYGKLGSDWKFDKISGICSRLNENDMVEILIPLNDDGLVPKLDKK